MHSRILLLAVVFVIAFIVPAQTQTPPGKDAKKLDAQIKEIAGAAEFLRSVPKHFATLQAVDRAKNEVALLIEGEVLPKVWPMAADAEIKVHGWWGSLADLRVGDRVWAWFKMDRQKRPASISMLADEISEQDIHLENVIVEAQDDKSITYKNVYGKPRSAAFVASQPFAKGTAVYVQTAVSPLIPNPSPPQGRGETAPAGAKARLVLDKAGFEKARDQQKQLMRKRWAEDGLPGSVSFVHVFSGEMDLMLDHQAMRWARALQPGDKVTLKAEPPIKGLVKAVQPWRERTQVRLVVHSFDLADLMPGQRVNLHCAAPKDEIDAAVLPPDIDRPRKDKQERIEWFLANIYCTCGVRGDRCTGHFYTLASCNPNACGQPKHMRGILGKKIDEGKTDRQIFEELVKDHGPELLKPHLLP
ncbi:MAG: hypothetical protein L0215_10310 [Gemmataceae bacterium]|nr:hypothetical protein [Gemmataceae bacterium]